MQTLILVDDDDKFLGYASREDCHHGDGLRHRAIAVILHNEKGEILLQKRRSSLWDGFWDLTGATHPLHLPERDETYEESGARFLHDEWNLETPLMNLFAFTYFERFGTNCENEYCALLVGEWNSEVHFNPEFAYDMCWENINTCLEKLREKPTRYTPWAIIAMEKLVQHPLGTILSSLSR